MKNLKLGTKLLLVFLCVSIIPLMVTGLISLTKANEALESAAFDQLAAVQAIKKGQIEAFFEERTGDLGVLTETVGAMLRGLSQNNENQAAINQLLATEYDDFFRNYQQTYGYYDLFLIAPDGYIFYTPEKESDYQTNMLTGPYRDSNLGHLTRQVIESRAIGLADFAPYAPSNGAPAAFLAQPLMVGEEIRMVVALQLSIDAINDIMQERNGMGETGETYLVGSDKLMRSDSYLAPSTHSVSASFANPTRGSVNTEAVREALDGRADSRIITDYNGNPVLSNFSPIKVGDATWAVIAEIDEAEAFAAVNTLTWVIGGIMLFCLIAISSVALLFARSLSRPVGKSVEMIEALASGNLDLRLNFDRTDEIGRLAIAMDAFADNLRDEVLGAFKNLADGNLTFEATGLIREPLARANASLTELITQLQMSGEQIASGAGQIADSSQSLSQGATESASSLEEISASLNQLSSQTSTNAENASTANQLAAEARTAAQQGSQKMQEMVTAMGDINEAGQSISKIIKVIDEIAFQTNLLALNAAVEAARAGQHGKGFAVVAEEVRNLAARSAKAAQETSDLIEGSVQKTAIGTTIAGQTAEALQSIVCGIGKVTDLVAEIAAASSEQAQGVNEINQGISQIDQVTQQNTASAEESAAASEELSGQAEQMREMLMRFTVNQGGGRSNSYLRAVPQKKTASKNDGWCKSAPAQPQKKIAAQKSIALDDDAFGKY